MINRPRLNFVWVVILLQVALINAHNLMALTLYCIYAWLGGVGKSNPDVINQSVRATPLAARHLIALCPRLCWGWGYRRISGYLLSSKMTSVSLQNLIGVSLLDYRNFFVPFGDLMACSRSRYDAGAINGLKELTILGVAQWGLALRWWTICALWHYTRGYRTRHPQTYSGAVYFTLMGLFMVWLVTPSAMAFWEFLSPLQLLQFPWRLLGPIAGMSWQSSLD